MTAPPRKVVCITGWCRNGSTIIGNVLNEIPGFFHVGELHFLWKNAAGQGANNRCGCGKSLTECALWSQIIPSAGRPGCRRRRSPTPSSPASAATSGPGTPGGCSAAACTAREIREHAELMEQTYHAIAERTGARVLVDTTKIPGESALLPHLTGLTPYYVHLVRDPRAVAGSWHRPKDYAYAMPASVSTAYWHGFNLAARAITRRHPQRSLFVRYEHFIADPAATIGALLGFCGADPSANPVRGRMVELRANHTVTGNPDRFRTGPPVIRETDDAWQAGLPVPGQARRGDAVLAAVAALRLPVPWHVPAQAGAGHRAGTM